MQCDHSSWKTWKNITFLLLLPGKPGKIVFFLCLQLTFLRIVAISVVLFLTDVPA